jgi:predicted metal-dependent TIM-barrel fold hydrolase
MILDMIQDDRRISPERVCIDHVEEHTIRPALDAGHWVGMTLYPITKCTPARAADMIEQYGDDRIMVNSAGDWGHSDPLAVPEFIFEMRRRGHDESRIRKIVYDNPLEFCSQSRRFAFSPHQETVAADGRSN